MHHKSQLTVKYIKNAAVGEKQACQTEKFSATDIVFNRLGVSLAPLLVFCIDLALQQPIRRRQPTELYHKSTFILYTHVHPP